MGRHSRFAIGILVVLWLLFFWRQIAGGEVWYCCDNLLVNIPSKVFLVSELTHGRFPLINPYIFSGTPFFADINLSILHPLNLLYFLLPPFLALTVGILALFLAGSIGMYYLGRTLRFGVFASLIGAVVFGFSGSLIVYANNIPILQVAVLVPWVLAAWIRGNLVIFVIVASLQVLSGHPQLTFYTWFMLVAYAIFEKAKIELIIRSAFAVAIVTSIQIIPFVWFALTSTRGVINSIDSIHPVSLVRLIIPGIVGNLARGTAWVQAGSMHGYVGILPLLFMPFVWKSRIGKFFLTVSVISIFLSTGTYAIAWFREPSQFLFFWSFGLSGVTMAAINNPPRQNRYILFVGLVFILLATVPWGTIALPGYFPERLLTKIASMPWDQKRIITEGLLYNFSLFGVLGILAALAIGRLEKSFVAKIILLGVIFTDLYIYGQTNVTTIAGTTVRRWQEAQRENVASWNLKSDTYRYYTDPSIYPYPGKIPLGQFNDPGESQWQFKILRPTLGMLYGLAAVDGYASMVKRTYQESFGVPARDPTGVYIPSIISPELKEAGVRYIITKPDNALLAGSKRYRKLIVDGEIAIYEDLEALPVTFLKGTE